MTSNSFERRKDDRIPVNWESGVTRAEGIRYSCIVLDISFAGARIRSDARVDVDEDVVLDIPELGEFAGTVRWTWFPDFGLALQAGPTLLIKRIAEDPHAYPKLMPNTKDISS